MMDKVLVKRRRRVLVVDQVEIENENKVAKSQWKKWSPQAKYVFNHVYATMKNNQALFLHPKTKEQDETHWNTTCWNAAWTAADAANETRA